MRVPFATPATPRERIAAGVWERWNTKGKLAPEGGRYFFTRVEIPGPTFRQNDPQWGDDRLGPTEGTLGAEGCAFAVGHVHQAFGKAGQGGRGNKGGSGKKAAHRRLRGGWCDPCQHGDRALRAA